MLYPSSKDLYLIKKLYFIGGRMLYQSTKDLYIIKQIFVYHQTNICISSSKDLYFTVSKMLYQSTIDALLPLFLESMKWVKKQVFKC